MPTISMFYGILIRMFYRDIEKHHTPHRHADYQGKVAVYSIPDGTVLAGGTAIEQTQAGRGLDRNSSRRFTCRLELDGKRQETFPDKGA